MTDALKQVFELKKKEVRFLQASNNLNKLICDTQGSQALVTFVTAGYPTLDETIPILLAMEDGGATSLN